MTLITTEQYVFDATNIEEVEVSRKLELVFMEENKEYDRYISPQFIILKTGKVDSLTMEQIIEGRK